MDAYNILLELVEMCLATITTMRVDWCYQIPITQYAFEWNVIFVEFNTQLVQIQVGSSVHIHRIPRSTYVFGPRSRVSICDFWYIYFFGIFIEQCTSKMITFSWNFGSQTDEVYVFMFSRCIAICDTSQAREKVLGWKI